MSNPAATSTVRCVFLRDGLEGPLRPLARFILGPEGIAANWFDDAFHREILGGGVAAMLDGQLEVLRPEDGARFLRALDIAYARSTMIVVTPHDELEARGR